jgi:hypothetical protein
MSPNSELQLTVRARNVVDRSGVQGASLFTPSSKIGDIFVKLGPFFAVYKEYVKNFDIAQVCTRSPARSLLE